MSIILSKTASKRVQMKKINKDLKKQFVITYNYYKCNINKFILMLQKDIYPYEYMDNWEKSQ